MAKKNVAANVVRAWAKDNLDKIAEAGHTCLGEGARGRLHPEVVTAFNRSHKNARYVMGTPSAESLITVQVMSETANGRKVPRKVTLTAAEVRDLTGHDGKGRIPNAVKERAAFAKIAG